MARCEITALALDMDGTLLTSDKRVTADTLATLRALLARGMSIFAVTGKAPRITARCLAPLQLPMVCLDGAVHVTGGVQRWVDGATIDDRLAARLLHDCGGPCYVLAGGATQVRGAVHEIQYVDWSDQIGRFGDAPLRRVTHVVFTHRERAALAPPRGASSAWRRDRPAAGSAFTSPTHRSTAATACSCAAPAAPSCAAHAPWRAASTSRSTQPCSSATG